MKPMLRGWGARTALTILLVANGCAYYNTLYYARQHYNEAEDARDRAPEGPLPESTRELYLKAARKCAKVITEHSGSRWVDDAILLMGNCFYRREEYEKALKKYEELVTVFPKSNLVREASFMRGMAMWNLGNYVDARTLFVAERERADGDKEKFRTGLMIGRTDLAAGKPDVAVTEIRELLDSDEADHDRAEALFWLGEALVATGELDEAKDAYADAAKRAKTEKFRRKIDLQTGEVLVKKGDHEEARRFFEDLASREMNPTERAKLTLRVAEAERSGGRLDAARATLEGIVDDVPKTEEAAEAQFRIGLIYEKDLRKYDDAMSAFEQVREISPGAEATRAAGEERQKILELQRIQGTLAELDSTRVIERAQSHFEIAEVLLLRMDDPEGALEHYRAAQAEDPPGDYGPRALLSASWVLEHDLERTDEAVEVLSELAAKYPASPQAERARSLLVEKGESIPDPDPIPMRRDEEPPKEEEGPAEQQPAEGGGDTTLEPAASDG